MHLSAIVVAAGKGLRFRSRIPKLLTKIKSHPAIIYSLHTLGRHPAIKDIILVVNRQNLKGIQAALEKYRIPKIRAVVLGGKLRQDSVYQGLQALPPQTDLVLIHDGARPFIERRLVSVVIKEARRAGAAIVGVPVKNTIKKVAFQGTGYRVQGTVERSNLWEIQTPQVFQRSLLAKAYQKFGKSRVTDDAILVEKMGVQVRIVPGSYNNIKITTPEDLVIAEAISRKWKAALA